ncbi:MAG TPA: hypothetical protein VOB72_00585 [Candidatus Dormibacteraeota bacterium]|nr:hypothetical protein [Candidatus Dormibacteraeota bacterium]
MNGHLWANRFVVLVCGLMLAASVLFAAEWSAIAPWSSSPPAALAAAPRAAHSVGSAAAPAATQPLFRDDFERDRAGAAPAGWTVSDGEWDGVVSDAGGRVVRHGAGAASYGHLAAGSPGWTDFRVTARLRPTSLSTGFAGVAARYRDRGDYYACGVYYGSAVRLWRVRGGDTTLLDARRQDVATDRFHDVSLVVKGARVSCVFDDSVVLSATDASFPSGGIALVAGSGEAAEFDDVVVST